MIMVAASKLKISMHIPTPPIPHIARPMTRASVVGAAPLTAEPASKRHTQTMYIYLALNRPNTLPYIKLIAAAPIRKASESHGSLLTALNCMTILVERPR